MYEDYSKSKKYAYNFICIIGDFTVKSAHFFKTIKTIILNLSDKNDIYIEPDLFLNDFKTLPDGKLSINTYMEPVEDMDLEEIDEMLTESLQNAFDMPGVDVDKIQLVEDYEIMGYSRYSYDINFSITDKKEIEKARKNY